MPITPPTQEQIDEQSIRFAEVVMDTMESGNLLWVQYEYARILLEGIAGCDLSEWDIETIHKYMDLALAYSNLTGLTYKGE